MFKKLQVLDLFSKIVFLNLNFFKFFGNTNIYMLIFLQCQEKIIIPESTYRTYDVIVNKPR